MEENLDILDWCIRAALWLIAAVSAFAWLKLPREAMKRSLLIVVAVYALMFIALFRSGNEHIEYWLPILMFRGDILVLLLGLFMLRQPWRKVLLSMGIYGLIVHLESVIYVVRAEGWDSPVWNIVLSPYMACAGWWLLYWIFLGRKGALRGGQCFVFAAATSHFCFTAEFLCRTAMRFLSLDVIGTLFVVPVLCQLFSLAAAMLVQRFVMQQAWPRILMMCAISLLPALVSCVMFFYYCWDQLAELADLVCFPG